MPLCRRAAAAAAGAGKTGQCGAPTATKQVAVRANEVAPGFPVMATGFFQSMRAVGGDGAKIESGASAESSWNLLAESELRTRGDATDDALGIQCN
ncbi:hypothetical protein AXG93_4448s1220 [Marchantia polymorpha subsp. ruderalis]|uniref:Uncharacterized protein n=1 Tax=Marchantia polymorpha subsp. ruderalis TaxID=1480154 RepID=A0A176VDP2_MARPO|nr:hypothetical protein AXG93_4448s1220 [Marchantia polymorpha subsp. ruderalis]